MSYWQGKLDRLLSDNDDLQDTLNCMKKNNPDSPIACMDESNMPVQEKVVFGGIRRTRKEKCGKNRKYSKD